MTIKSSDPETHRHILELFLHMPAIHSDWVRGHVIQVPLKTAVRKLEGGGERSAGLASIRP